MHAACVRSGEVVVVAVARVAMERPSCLGNGSLSSAPTASENGGPWEHAREGSRLRMQDVMEWDMTKVVAQWVGPGC